MNLIEQFKALNPRLSPIEEFATFLPEGTKSGKGQKPYLDAGDLAGHWKNIIRETPGRVRWNLMSQEVEIDRVPLTAKEQECIYIPVQQRGWNVTKQAAQDALAIAAQVDAYHPIRDYLDSIKDVPAIDISRLASTYLRPSDQEKEQTIYDRMLIKTLVGAVKRAYEPGCQHDTCLVLKGAQGIRKTTFWRTLFEPYFAIFRDKIGNKDALLVVHANWALELGELDHITSGTHAGHLKNFLSTNADHFRTPWGVKSCLVPRPSIFVGSCNEGDFLYDNTGSRRWWIIPCEQTGQKQIDTDQLAKDKTAIWSSARKLYLDRETTYLSPEDERLNNVLNDDFAANNPLEEPINQYLAKYPEHDYINPTDLIDHILLHSSCAKSFSGRQIQIYVKQEMTRRGFSYKRGPVSIFGDNRPRRWCRE